MNGRLEREPNFYRPQIELVPGEWHPLSAGEIRAMWQQNMILWRQRRLFRWAFALSLVAILGGNLMRAALHYEKWSWLVR